MDGMKLKLDLHDIYNRGQDIHRALRGIIDEAVAKKATRRWIRWRSGSVILNRRSPMSVEKSTSSTVQVFLIAEWYIS